MVAATAVLLGVVGCVIAALEGPAPAAELMWLVMAIVAPFAVSGAFVASRLPRNPIGWLLLGVSLSQALGIAAGAHAEQALVLAPGSWRFGREAAWLADLMWWPSLALIPFVLVLFPDGRVPSRRWLPAMWGGAAGLALAVLAAAAGTWPTRGSSFAGDGAITGAALVVPVGLTGAALMGAFVPASVIALLVRWRRSSSIERLQLNWMAVAGVLTLAGMVFIFLRPPQAAQAFGAACFAAVPAAITVGVVRYRLWDLGFLVNRSVLYVLLSGLLVALYLGTVAVVSAISGGASLAVQVVVVVAVALAAQPLRTRLQRVVNRLTFGDRHDPYAVLAGLGQRLEATMGPASVLPELVEAVARSMGFGHVAVLLEGDGGAKAAAVYGRPDGTETAIPLIQQGRHVGELVVGARPAQDPLTERDRRLLTDLARQVAIAARAALLADAVQRSREQLVTAREEERRRLRRELHDGLGPTLAAIAAGIEVLAGQREGGPSRDRLLERLTEAASGTLEQVRHLARDLRPPALDALGLRGALQQSAAEIGLSLTISGDHPLATLPAAAEVAAYRIASEAFVNVARHAQVDRCALRLEVVGADLLVEVRDDGRGISPHQAPGVGLLAMQERAAELGGSCSVTAADAGGTRVLAALPLRDGMDDG